jgi:CDP-diglyceride synthetase
VLAHKDIIASKLGREYRSTAEFEDNPEAPRIGFVPVETVGGAEGAVIGTGVYVPAIAGSLAVVASGGTMLGAIAAAAIAGGAGGLIGAAVARRIGSKPSPQGGGMELAAMQCPIYPRAPNLAYTWYHPRPLRGAS